MKGIVFNLLEEVVSRAHGEDVWDTLVEAAQVDGVYTALGTYPDEDLGRLVAAAAELLATPADEVTRWFGRGTMPLFVERYPELLTAHASVRSLALALNDVIHPEVHKLYPGAVTPEFTFDTSAQDVLVIEYRSPRQLCMFAEGLLYGAADHYGEHLSIDHPSCQKRGDDRCLLAIRG